MALTEVDGPVLPTADGTGETPAPSEPAVSSAADMEPIVDDGTGAEKFPLEEPAAAVEDDDGDHIDEPAATKKPNRKARRAQRYDELKSRAEQAEAAARDAAARAARFEGMLQAYQQGTQPAAAPAPDPQTESDSKLESIEAQMDNLTKAMQASVDKDGKIDKEVEGNFRREYAKLQRSYHREIARSVQPEPAAQTPDQAQMAATRVHIEAQFPDVYHNQNAARYAKGEYDRLVAMGHPEGLNTVQLAWQGARQQFGQQNGQGQQYVPAHPGPQYPVPPPSYMPPGANTRLMGAPPGGAGAAVQSPVDVALTPAHKKIADHLYPYEPTPKIRYQRYVNEVAKPHLQRMRPKRG